MFIMTVQINYGQQLDWLTTLLLLQLTRLVLYPMITILKHNEHNSTVIIG